MRKFIFVLLIFSLLLCKKRGDNEEEKTYEVITFLYDTMVQPIEPMFPPPPPDSLNHEFSSKDSVRIISMIEKIKIERENKKYIIAIHPQLNLVSERYENKNEGECFGYSKMLNKLKSFKSTKKIEINRIRTKRNDSIIYFKKDLVIKGHKDYETFDVLVSFSRIAFNENFTKAILRVSVSTSKLAGSSILYFLEKTNGSWKIKCEEEISIA